MYVKISVAAFLPNLFPVLSGIPLTAMYWQFGSSTLRKFANACFIVAI